MSVYTHTQHLQFKYKAVITSAHIIKPQLPHNSSHTKYSREVQLSRLKVKDNYGFVRLHLYVVDRKPSYFSRESVCRRWLTGNNNIGTACTHNAYITQHQPHYTHTGIHLMRHKGQLAYTAATFLFVWTVSGPFHVGELMGY